jgi:hypothetical protein
MAAGQWVIYDSFRNHMADGACDLDGGGFKIGLMKSTTTACTSAGAVSTWASASASNQVDNGAGYTTGGKSTGGSGGAGVAATWASGASGGQYKFDSTATIWTASGGDITSIMYAILYDSNGGEVIAYSQLSSAIFTVTSGNTLTITPDATNGYFTLT